MHIDIRSNSELATTKLGQLMGVSIGPFVLALVGDLGVGKTHFVQGLAKGLGIESDISSPTFTLVAEHDNESDGLNLIHMDAYRLSGSNDFIDSGLDEYFYQKAVVVIEWADLVMDALPPNRLKMEFTRLGDLSIPDVVETVAGSLDQEAVYLPQDNGARNIRISYEDELFWASFLKDIKEQLIEHPIEGLLWMEEE